MQNATDTRSRSERTWAMAAHMSALCLYLGLIFTNLLFPYLIWRWSRKHSAYVAVHALEAMNFQITVTLAGLISLLGAWVIPWLWTIVIAVFTANIVYVGRAADRARDGLMGNYPITIPWIRPARPS